jgi:hypothetical protein
MSDKTKHRAQLAATMAEAARMRRKDLDAAQRDPLPRCACGFTWLQTEIWAHQVDRWSPLQYFCAACRPAGSQP